MCAGAGSSQPGGGAGDGEQPPHQAARQTEERQVCAAEGSVTGEPRAGAGLLGGPCAAFRPPSSRDPSDATDLHSVA